MRWIPIQINIRGSIILLPIKLQIFTGFKKTISWCFQVIKVDSLFYSSSKNLNAPWINGVHRYSGCCQIIIGEPVDTILYYSNFIIGLIVDNPFMTELTERWKYCENK